MGFPATSLVERSDPEGARTLEGSGGEARGRKRLAIGRQRVSGVEAAIAVRLAVVVELETERVGRQPVVERKWQAGIYDPGMEALKGAPVAG